MLNVTPPPVKFELRAYGETHDVSDMLDEWQKLEVVLSRKETSGVYREMSVPFRFKLEAKDLIKSIFDGHGQFRAKADVYVYIRKNDWTYEPPYIFNLDFLTYVETDETVEIGARKTDLYEFLKTKESINYDIPVEEIKAGKWKNNRVKLNNRLTELIDANIITAGLGKSDEYVRTVGITYFNQEIYAHDVLHGATVSDDEDASNPGSSWFVEAQKDIDLDLKLTAKFNMKFTTRRHTNDYSGLPTSADVFFIIEKYEPSVGTYPLISIGQANIAPQEMIEGGYATRIFTVSDANATADPNANPFCTVSVPMKEGDKLRAVLLISLHGADTSKMDDTWYSFQSFGLNETYNERIDNNEREIYGPVLEIKYIERDEPVLIDCIRPGTLLRKLVDKITETENVYTAAIDYPFNTNTHDLTLFAAAESIRQIPEAKVHTSYKDFKAWMYAFGYEPFVNGNTLTFRRRKSAFDKDVVAIELSENECADLKISVDKDYVFSGVKIGYNKKDYENINGRFEFNGIMEYSTDLSVNDKILELVSPYRADCFGIEFLTLETKKDTTDDKSDKDIFLINVEPDRYGEGFVTVYRPGTENQNIPHEILETVFNTAYSPNRLLEPNMALIAASANKLTFAASDANSDYVVDGEPIKSDVEISPEHKLFDAVEYDVASENIKHLPVEETAINGFVRFRYKGNVYEGFVKEITKNYARETESTWKLLKKS